MITRLVSRMPLVAFRAESLVGYASLGGPTQYDPQRHSRTTLNELFDILWQIRRGKLECSQRKLILADGPNAIMACRAWAEFVDDGLLRPWVQQMLRRDVLYFLKPPARLACIVLDVAKILNKATQEGARQDLLARRSIDGTDAKYLTELLEKMIEVVFVDRNQTTFKHVSAATEALGRFSQLLNPQQYRKDAWVNAIQEWTRSGRLSSALSENGSTSFGLSSLSGFLGGLARLDCRPPEKELLQLVLACQRLVSKAIGTRFLTPKSLVDFARTWHTWRFDPESGCEGWWSTWFKAYEDVLKRPRDRGGLNAQMTSTLVQTALLMAKDFKRTAEIEGVSAITESTLTELIKLKSFTPSRASQVLTLIEALNRTGSRGPIFGDDSVIFELRKLSNRHV